MPRSLVTGCAGFVGSHLTEALLGGGHEVVGVDCFSDNYPAAQKLANLARAREHGGFELHALDLAGAGVAPLLEGCDTVFHLAAEPGVRSSWGRRFDRFVHNNVEATQRLLEALREDSGPPAPRLVYASSSSVYGESERLPTPEDAPPRPLSPYGVTKLAGEQLCRVYHVNHGVETVALRFFTVYGPRQRPDMAFRRFCEAAARGRAIELFGDGGQSRDFTYVGDTVRAIRAAAAAPGAAGRAYNVGGGAPVSVNAALGQLAALAGRPLDVRRSGRESGDVLHTAADTSRARDELGFAPATSLEEGLDAELRWVLDRVAPRARAVSARRS